MQNNKLGTIRTMADDLADVPQDKIPVPEEKPTTPKKIKTDMPQTAKTAVKHLSEIHKPTPKPVMPEPPVHLPIQVPPPVPKPPVPEPPKPITPFEMPVSPKPQPLTPPIKPVPEPIIQPPKIYAPPEPPEMPAPKPYFVKPPLEPMQAPKAPPPQLPVQKTSRELLDELLPMEEPVRKPMPAPKLPTTPPVQPMQDIQPVVKTIPEVEIKNKDLEEEIFPSPQIQEEIPTETPEELLGLKIEELEEEMPPVPQPPKMEIPESILRPKETPPAPLPISPAPPPPPILPMPPAAPPAPPAPQAPLAPPPAPPAPPQSPLRPTFAKPSIFAPFKKLLISKTVLLTALLVIFGAALVSTSLYLIFSRDEEPGQIVEEEPKQEEPNIDTTPPTPLVNPDFVLENVSVEDALENSLITAINKLKTAELTKDSIAYVPIRLEGVVVDNKAQFLKLQTFFSGLGIATPIEFFDIMEPDFMLYLYTPGDEERIACQNNLVAEKDCWGPRLGMVFRVKPGYSHRVDPILTQWIDLIRQYDSNIDKFILNDIAQMPQEKIFNEGTYKSQAVLKAKTVKINYVNIPMPQYDNLELSGTALDIATVNDMLIIATSKNSMRKIIDYILQQ